MNFCPTWMLCTKPLLYKAEDLVQEAYLHTLSALSTGKVIDNPKAYLLSVMNNRFFMDLRKKYKLSTVYYDEMPIEPSYEDSGFDAIIKSEEAEIVRRELAFLSKTYRDVMVLYYMKNLSVREIAKTLSIPKGTVLSRLDYGREKVKKGVEEMDTYGSNSYQPEKLFLGISGIQGLNGEPWSVTEDNQIMQNILIIAYEKPLTELEIAKTIGIPAAYVEPIIEKLIDEELMARNGKKVYTNFIIFKAEENTKYIAAQQSLIDENFELIWNPLNNGLAKLKTINSYDSLSEHAKKKLEYYFIVECLAGGFFTTGRNIYNWDDTRPDRPHGGKWDAMAHAVPQNYDLEVANQFSYSGARRNEWNNTLGAKQICLHVYDTPLEKKSYRHLKNNTTDGDLAKMLYIINENIDPQNTGINSMFFENIPYLIECGVLKNDDGSVAIDIPVISKEQYNEMLSILREVVGKFSSTFKEKLKVYLDKNKTEIPSHLKSVPFQFQYMKPMGALNMMTIFKAKEQGLILENVDFPCPPMVLVVEK